MAKYKFGISETIVVVIIVCLGIMFAWATDTYLPEMDIDMEDTYDIVDVVDITGSGDATMTGTVQGGTVTDGTTSITGGNYTGVGNITGTDIDITAGTGDYIASGDITATKVFFDAPDTYASRDASQNLVLTDPVMGSKTLSELYATKNLVNGTFRETFNALVTSDAVNVTMSIYQADSGDLTMQFSDGETNLDCTPAATIALTAGSDVSPTENYIYIPQSTKVLTKSTSDWPSTEHIRIGFFLVPSAGFVQSKGVYINQNWNDHLMGTNNQGHLTHIAERSRYLDAQYHDGVDGNGDASTYVVRTDAAPDTVYIKTTSGVVLQMHRHTVPAYDTSGSDIFLVVNDNTTAYDNGQDLYNYLTDADGDSMSGRYYNLVLWGVVNKSNEYAPLMINLPTGSYNKQLSAEKDVSGYDVFTIPRVFNRESSTGFLIARLTMKHSTGGQNLELISTVDLRGTTPQTATGGVSGITTEFADNTFKIFDETDITKILAVDVGTNVTTGNTRTITMADRDVDLDTPTFTSITIGGNTLNTSEWVYLDGLDQSTKASDDITASKIVFDAPDTYASRDITGNLHLVDAVTGDKTLAELAAEGGTTISLWQIDAANNIYNIGAAADLYVSPYDQGVWIGAGEPTFPSGVDGVVVIEDAGNSPQANADGKIVFWSESGALDDFCKLLLHFEDSDGATNTSDSSNFSHDDETFVGTAHIEADQSAVGSSFSLELDGNSDCITYPDDADWYDADKNFTKQFWFRLTTTADISGFMGQGADGANERWYFYFNTNNKIYCAFIDNTVVVNYYYTTDALGVVTNTWYHFAYVRDGAKIRMYLNGASIPLTEVDAVTTNTMPDVADDLQIGCALELLNDFSCNGFMDEVKLDKGIARYDLDFGVETTEWGTTHSKGFMMDGNSNAVCQTPHKFKLFKPSEEAKAPWSYYSRNKITGIEVNGDQYGALREVEELSELIRGEGQGKKFIYERRIPMKKLTQTEEERLEGWVKAIRKKEIQFRKAQKIKLKEDYEAWLATQPPIESDVSDTEVIR